MKRVLFSSLVFLLIFSCIANAQFSSFFSEQFVKTQIKLVTNYGAKGDGTHDDSTAFANAGVASANKIMYIPPGTYKISSNVTIGSTVEVWFSNGVVLSVDNTKTLTISGKLTSPYIPTNSGSGTFTYSGADIPLYSSGESISINNQNISIPTTDGSYSGCTVVPLIANEDQAFSDLCYINTDGEAQIGDGDAEATSRIVVVCVSATVSAGATGNYALIDAGGMLYKTAWNWATVGEILRLSTTGTSGNTWSETTLTGTDDANVIVGIALSTHVVMLSRLLVIEHN